MNATLDATGWPPNVLAILDSAGRTAELVGKLLRESTRPEPPRDTPASKPGTIAAAMLLAALMLMGTPHVEAAHNLENAKSRTHRAPLATHSPPWPPTSGRNGAIVGRLCSPIIASPGPHDAWACRQVCADCQPRLGIRAKTAPIMN